MADTLDCVIVGAGVVGLSVARSLAVAGREVFVLEAESQIGMHTSSRNSEVIHAGLYYPEGSLKARLCVRGRELLYRYCDKHRIACERTGKLIVACHQEDLDKLHAIEQQARRNGVDDLRFLDAADARKLEPAVVCEGAFLSPSTGIVDTHELMTALQAEIEAHGGAVVLNSRVSDLSAVDGALRFESSGEVFVCRTLVNAAGLWAQELLSGLVGRGLEVIPPLHLAKGHYFSYQATSPFRHLVYPVPADGGLGIHATNDMSGMVRFGPDVVWVESVDYDFEQTRKADFVAAIRSYFPDLDESKLVPAYTGIRPKLSAAGEPPADFLIEGERDHGVPGLVNLFGIESPGLTATLAIGDHVKELLS